MAISSPGLGSNLDVNGIITKLMSVEQAPLTRLTAKEAEYQAKLSAYGTVQSAVSSFNSSLSSLRDISKFNSLTASSSDSSVASASATSIATPGSYSLAVSKLASGQQLVAAGQQDATAAIGTGTITFDFGTINGEKDPDTGQYYFGTSFTSNGSGAKSVTIDSTNNTLTGIRDAINMAKIGVTATIINAGGDTPYRLALTSDSMGASQSVKISVSGEAAGSTALSDLIANDPEGTQNLSETVSAQNAEFTVNGVAVSKTSNTVTDVVQGVTLNLLKTTDTTPVTVSVSRSATSAASSISSFVKAYNDLNAAISSVSSYDAKTKTGGPLVGDSALRLISSQIRNAISTPIQGILESGSNRITTLSQIGVQFQRDGSLSFDTSKLQNAVNNSADVAALFAAVGRSSDSLVNVLSTSSGLATGSYALNISTLASKGFAEGGVVANTTVTAGVNDTIELALDGTTSEVTIAPGDYGTASALATAIQSAINSTSAFSNAGVSATVTESGGFLTVTSSRLGSSSTVQINGESGTGALSLFGLASSTDGTDVAGTINGIDATGEGQILTSDDGQLKLEVLGGATGDRGYVNFTRGYGHILDTLTAGYLGSKGTLKSATDGINTSISDLGKDRNSIQRHLTELEARYRRQFTALDTLMAQMTQTSNYLSQQLANLK